MPVTLSGERQIEYFYEAEDGTLICVTADKSNIDQYYKSFKLYVGDGDVMKEIPVLNTLRFRGSRGAFIVTEENRLHFPAFKSGIPRYGSMNLVSKLNVVDYNIAEHPDGRLTITRR